MTSKHSSGPRSKIYMDGLAYERKIMMPIIVLHVIPRAKVRPDAVAEEGWDGSLVCERVVVSCRTHPGSFVGRYL